MIGWRAWVWDGQRATVYSSADAEWQDVPRRGVVGVVVYSEPPYRRIIDGHDWVWIEGGEFRIVDTHPDPGQWAGAPKTACDPCMKRGASVPDGEWERLQREMMAAREAP